MIMGHTWLRKHNPDINWVTGDVKMFCCSYQNLKCQSYEVTLKAGCQGYGMLGFTGSAGAYDVGVRTQPQLIGCALAQELGVLNFGLRVANNGGR